MLITLTTDFGDSEYVGAMKGVIRSIAPDIEIVDITHGVRRHSIRHGAYALQAAVPHFPFAVHVAVIDPGVGTERRPLVLACEGAYLVGPDNGVLLPAARRLGLKQVRHATSSTLFRSQITSTFHGRDVFAPLAAHLATGTKLGDVGPELPAWTDLDWGRAVETPEGLRGQILCADRFGNVITNVGAEAFTRRFPLNARLTVTAGKASFKARVSRTYAEGLPGEAVALVGSGGYVEIAVNRASAEQQFGLREAEPCLFRPV